MQLMRDAPASKDWHVQASRAAPVSSPLQKDETGSVVSQEVTQAPSFWANVMRGAAMRRKMELK